MLKRHYKDVFDNQFKHWWYKGMTSINLTLLDYFLVKKRNLKILDAGCGPGVMLKPLKRYGDVVGIDMSNEALKYARKIGKAKKGDIMNLKFKDNTFDLVICMDVLYHEWVKKPEKALQEFKRVLKDSGILLVREPAYNWMRGNEDRGSLTARRFSKGELEKDFINNGFEVLKISYANFFLFPFVFAVRVFGMITNKGGSSDMSIPSKTINDFLFKLLRLESNLIKYIGLPFGSSIVCVARKKMKKEIAREEAINLYSRSPWEKFLSNFKFWEEPYEVVDKMIPDRGIIVELGCGEGLLTNYLALSSPKRKIFGYELVPERLKIARKGIKNTKYAVADATKQKLSKADIYILFHVLHHLPSKKSQEEVLQKVTKALKRNGRLIIVDVHVTPSIKYLAAWIADHFLVPWVFEKRFFTRAYFRSENEWKKLLKDLEYKVATKIETKGRPFPNIIFECRL